MRYRAKRAVVILVCAAAVLVTAPLPQSRAADEKLQEKQGPVFNSVTLRMRHRVFEYFVEDQTVSLNEPFQIGDTDLHAEVLRFVPDFAIATNPRRILSRTPEPNNPAFQIAVFENDEPADTSWAFLNMPPHFSQTSMLSFLVLKIAFEDRDPLWNRDTTRAKLVPKKSESDQPEEHR
jgi:hypothetical protein